MVVGSGSEPLKEDRIGALVATKEDLARALSVALTAVKGGLEGGSGRYSLFNVPSLQIWTGRRQCACNARTTYCTIR